MKYKKMVIAKEYTVDDQNNGDGNNESDQNNERDGRLQRLPNGVL